MGKGGLLLSLCSRNNELLSSATSNQQRIAGSQPSTRRACSISSIVRPSSRRGALHSSAYRSSLARARWRCDRFYGQAASSRDGITEEADTWQRVQLLERLLDLSISEEDYLQAKRIHDQLSELKLQLSDSEQSLLALVNNLSKGSLEERIEAITALGDKGDNRVLPMLANTLFDENIRVASETEKAIWKIFMFSGRDDVDQKMQQGVTLMVSKELTAAREIFTEVIKMDPLFAEGWNKRATIYYLLEDYHASIEDCKRTLQLNPYHFGALSGMGLCYVAIDNLGAALLCFEKAYALHPGLTQVQKYIEVIKQKLASQNESKDDDP